MCGAISFGFPNDQWWEHLFICLFAIHVSSWSISAILLPIKKHWNAYFLIIEVGEHFIYSGYEPFIRYLVCQYFASIFSESVVCLFILLICTHFFHTWLLYFIACILCTVDVLLSQDGIAGDRKNYSVEFVWDTRADRWARRGFLELFIQSHFLCQKKGMLLLCLLLVGI